LEYFPLYILGGFFAFRVISKIFDMSSDANIRDVYQKTTANYTYKHYYNKSGIGIDSVSQKIHLFSQDGDKIYNFSDVRKWTTNYASGGEVITGDLRAIGLNRENRKNNENKTGLFIHVRDIDNPIWQINFSYGNHTDKELAKWMEILTQFLNEDKTDPDADLIEKLSEWSCDRESPQFMAQLNALSENLRAQIHQRYMQKNTAKWHVFKARLDAVPEEDRTAELRRQIRKEVGQLGI
jgi:hypothetical protein